MLKDFLDKAKVKAEELKNSALQYKNKSFLHACAAGSVLVARADGTVSQEERQKMMALIKSNDALSVFDQAEVIKVFNEYLGYFDFDVDVGNSKALDALNKIRTDQAQARTVMRLIIAIANSDGTFDNDERHIARQVAQELNVDPAEFGV